MCFHAPFLGAAANCRRQRVFFGDFESAKTIPSDRAPQDGMFASYGTLVIPLRVRPGMTRGIVVLRHEPRVASLFPLSLPRGVTFPFEDTTTTHGTRGTRDEGQDELSPMVA